MFDVMKILNNFSRCGKTNRDGYLLFYVMGMVGVLSMFGIVSAGSASLEARSAQNWLNQSRAQMNAKAGIEIVKAEVESGLASGQSLAAVLSSLSVTPPTGVDFDTINSFTTVVPNRIFQVSSVGRSGGSQVTMSIQFRRAKLFRSSAYGTTELSTNDNAFIYGYDSQVNPQPSSSSDSNGQATVGSNVEIEFGSNLTLDGPVLVGADSGGAAAGCTGCFGEELQSPGHLEPDPLGANNSGRLTSLMTDMSITNDNGSNAAIVSNALITSSGDSVTFTEGDYYLTEITIDPNSIVEIDNSSGPVRFFVDGPIDFKPMNANAMDDPLGFQIYATSSDDIEIGPDDDYAMFVYAPNAEVTLTPNGNLAGNFWAFDLRIEPEANGVVFLDSTIQERWLSNELVIHTQYENRLQ